MGAENMGNRDYGGYRLWGTEPMWDSNYGGQTMGQI